MVILLDAASLLVAVAGRVGDGPDAQRVGDVGIGVQLLAGSLLLPCLRI